MGLVFAANHDRLFYGSPARRPALQGFNSAPWSARVSDKELKRCPTCNRLENDDALVFCRADGAALVRDSAPSGSEAGTAKLNSSSLAGEISTGIPGTTDAVINPGTGPTTVLQAQPATHRKQ